ncbi:hypothetical protein JMJ77_0010553, partial [Colletotrichum scovillei]
VVWVDTYNTDVRHTFCIVSNQTLVPSTSIRAEGWQGGKVGVAGNTQSCSTILRKACLIHMSWKRLSRRNGYQLCHGEWLAPRIRRRGIVVWCSAVKNGMVCEVHY